MAPCVRTRAHNAAGSGEPDVSLSFLICLTVLVLVRRRPLGVAGRCLAGLVNAGQLLLGHEGSAWWCAARGLRIQYIRETSLYRASVAMWCSSGSGGKSGAR